MLWKNLLEMQVFDESQDTVSSRPWPLALLMLSALTVAAGMGVACYLLQRDLTALPGIGIAIGSLSVMSGATYHMGLHGQAKNGVLLSLLLAAVMSLLTTV